MPVCEVEGGVRVAYQDRGSGRPLVFVHGWGGQRGFQALLDEDLRVDVGDLEIPVAVFAGRHDQIWDPRWSDLVAETGTDVTLRYFEGSGHVAFIEEREAWNAALVDFVEHSV